MQPASTIPVIELEDAIHMNSYREFVLSNDDESITIDEAEQKYSEYFNESNDYNLDIVEDINIKMLCYSLTIVPIKNGL